jgi:tetratricopeptide (TPR) repeat protein
VGNSIEGEASALLGLARDPARAALYALLSEARRARGDLSGARVAIDEGVARAPRDATLGIELGMVRAAQGDIVGAEQAWHAVLVRQGLHPVAFAHLAALAMRRADATGAQTLVDLALAGPSAHVDVLRCALRVAHAMEPQGVAREARVATLARSLLTREPEDAGAAMALAYALARTGETSEAARAFARVEALAVHTPLAAEAQRARFALGEPLAAQEIDAVLRAAVAPSSAAALDALSVRARRLAAEHPVWPAWVAFGIVERRRGALASAREALSAALAACDGCSAAHRELARVDAAAADEHGAMAHAERAVALEGETPAALGAMAAALGCAGRRAEATTLVRRALSIAPDDAELVEIAQSLRASEVPPSRFARLRESFLRLRGR